MESSVPALEAVALNPAGVVNATEYVPGARLPKLYAPLLLDVVLAIWVPELLSNLTDTPEMPGSPESWMPLALLSLKTKLPIEEQFVLAVITTLALDADVQPVPFLTVNV